MQVLGAIEAGGTKVVCAVAEQPDGALIERRTFPTTTPEETIGLAVSFFQRYSLSSLGLVSFGPLDLNPASSTYGTVTATPKPGWKNADWVGPFRAAFDVPLGLDSDVNGSARGEAHFGAGKNADPLVYFTVGTGIGGGLLVNGQAVLGWSHSEMGHFAVKRHVNDHFKGGCPYHDDCLEGMASGPAIQARWGAAAESLPADHPAWALEAYYLAQAVCTVLYAVSPRRVIFGGGVMHQPQLFPLIRQQTVELLNGYLVSPTTDAEMAAFIVPPGLGDDSGIRGALTLAVDALSSSK